MRKTRRRYYWTRRMRILFFVSKQWSFHFSFSHSEQIHIVSLYTSTIFCFHLSFLHSSQPFPSLTHPFSLSSTNTPNALNYKGVRPRRRRRGGRRRRLLRVLRLQSLRRRHDRVQTRGFRPRRPHFHRFHLPRTSHGGEHVVADADAERLLDDVLGDVAAGQRNAWPTSE